MQVQQHHGSQLPKLVEAALGCQGNTPPVRARSATASASLQLQPAELVELKAEVRKLRGAIATMQAMLAAGAPVDAKADGLTTPLHWAAQTDQQDAIDALVEAGASLTVKDTNGNTPLKLAKSRDASDAVYALKRAAKKRKATKNKAKEEV